MNMVSQRIIEDRAVPSSRKSVYLKKVTIALEKTSTARLK